MLRKIGWSALLLLAFATNALAQANDKDEEKFLRASLENQTLFVRGFSGDSVIREQWDGNAMIPKGTPKFHEVVALKIDKVKFSNSSVEIHGERILPMTVGQHKIGSQLKLGFASTEETILISYAASDRDSLFTGLKQQVFFSSPTELVAALPHDFQNRTAKMFGLPEPTEKVPSNCDCTVCTDAYARGVTGNTPPKLLFHVEPEYPEEARLAKISAEIEVGFLVTKGGKVIDPWVLESAPDKLDVAAANAVTRYRFQPATCHGTPVDTRLYMDVTFQIF